MSSEALRLADELDSWAKDYATTDYTDAMAVQSASLLRTQAARIAELEAEVERLRKPLAEALTYTLAEEICDGSWGPVGGPMEAYQFEPDSLIQFVRAIEAAKDAP